MRPLRRIAIVLASFLVDLSDVTAGPAERAMEVARIHVEAMGGAARINSLKALRARGAVLTGTDRVAFTLIAARPNRVRLETRAGDRSLVQACNGTSPPWKLVTAGASNRATLMAPAEAEFFLIDSEFDDPLVGWAEGGFSLQYAGEATVDGQKLLRILVARTVAQNIFLLLDPHTYLIAVRAQVLTRDGGRTEVVTSYSDYRPVAGVLIAHDVRVSVNGRVAQHAKFEHFEANPVLPDGYFEPPAELIVDRTSPGLPNQ